MLDISERVIDADPPALVRFYDPDPRRTKPIFIYLHGGGWSLFDIDTHDRVSNRKQGSDVSFGQKERRIPGRAAAHWQ